MWILIRLFRITQYQINIHETRIIKRKYIVVAQYETKYGEVTRYRTFYKEQIKVNF